ncbi:hypothetical protein LUZ61_020713 [Rhynchospora tenuis]|uniref:F-box domain-containing protein n=1 Tax=Rhynchospora tenuis TaxID=198213 RepID=A0AAD6EP27_9POAL|nr:hypothetical protein LUZ61_020713 [Rhynchospora tenuis]
MDPKEARILMGLWSQLPIDIGDNIIKRLDSPADVLSFGAVCKTWRYVSMGVHMSLHCKLPMHHFLPKGSPLPMLLHAGCEGPNMHQLYSLNEQKIYGQFHLVELSNKWIVGSGCGWLVTMDTIDAELNLLDPLTGKKIPLPLLLLPSWTADWYIKKVIVGSYKDTLVVVVLLPKKGIRFCRIRDSKWMEISRCSHDVIMHNNKLYAVDYLGETLELDIAEPSKERVVAIYPGAGGAYTEGCFLVDLCGKLVVILKMLQLKKVRGKGECAMISEFKVFNLEDGYWASLESLNHHMVFIGYNHSLSLDSRVYPNCQGNCIYFADCWDDQYGYDRMRGNLKQKLYHDVGVYHLGDGRMEHFENFCKASSRMNMVWFSPNFSTE